MPGCVPPTVATATWEPPFGFVKLNFDGSVNLATHYAGYGGIIRDHIGNMIVSYAAQLETNYPPQAELHGLHKGLELVIHYQFQNVIVEGDALLICRAFQGHSIFAWNLILTWKKIVSSVKRISQCSSMYYFQMANIVADALSKVAPPSYTDFTSSLPPDIDSLYVQEQLFHRRFLIETRASLQLEDLDETVH
eukprot:TRINITY_DN16319_c0_g2_i1.p1 TRINITY_DN16319_c0_g2~~TRINITY_DN16319_c0_g2_i1.p1  ORF type:complete len:193 (+),score=35.03 TRINITY_DN16319_c0_g2_i1:1512-2090(+)